MINVAVLLFKAAAWSFSNRWEEF